MKDGLHKMFSALLVAGCFIALGGAAAYAQGRDSALRTGGSNSGSSELLREKRESREAEKRERRAALRASGVLPGAEALAGTIEFADMARALGVDEADLRDEYKDDHEDFSWLKPVGYFTVKMLINTARREQADVEISRRDLLKSMVKGTLPVQYLVNKGFTAAEAEKVIKLTDQRLTAISKGAQK